MTRIYSARGSWESGWKVCPRCKRRMPVTIEYWKRSNRTKSGFRSYCRYCQKQHDNRYAQWTAPRIWHSKLTALEAYGGKCVCCAETNPVFLTFDHIGGGGNVHRKSSTLLRHNVGLWLIRNSFPDTFRVLCWNCHMAIDRGPAHLNGVCPHKLPDMDPIA